MHDCSLIKNIIDKCINAYYANWNPLRRVSKKINNVRNYIYSKKNCKLFNCVNVWFKRPINFTKGEQFFSIGEGTSFGKFAVLTAWENYEGETYIPSISIGKNCNFGDFLHLTCIKKITIGNNVLTGRWVTISDNGHGETDYQTLQIPPIIRRLSYKGPVIIGDNLWIGDKATILSGIRIGNGVVIAANAVVTKDIPSFCIAVGNPAKVIKRTF